MRVYLDTNCIIYLVQRHPDWCPKVVAKIKAIQAAGDGLAVGDVARAECLVLPFKTGDLGLEVRYRDFFRDPEIDALALSTDICERAARLRATYGFRLADALQLATAIEHGCGRFLTGDAQLARCAEIAVDVLT